MRRIERAAYGIGGLLILSGLVHIAILVAGGGAWEARYRCASPLDGVRRLTAFSPRNFPEPNGCV